MCLLKLQFPSRVISIKGTLIRKGVALRADCGPAGVSSRLLNVALVCKTIERTAKPSDLR